MVTATYRLKKLPANFGGELGQLSTVSEFSFQIISIGSEPLHDKHAAFNAEFSRQFPKLLYTNPSSSYTDAGFLGLTAFGGQSQIHAVGESALSPEATKAIIIQILRNVGINAGIVGTINFNQYTISQIEAGATLKPPVYTAPNPGGTNTVHIPGISYQLPDLTNVKIPELPNIPNPSNFLDSLGKTLGLDKLASELGLVATTATLTAVVVGGVFLAVMLKR